MYRVDVVERSYDLQKQKRRKDRSYTRGKGNKNTVMGERDVNTLTMIIPLSKTASVKAYIPTTAKRRRTTF